MGTTTHAKAPLVVVLIGLLLAAAPGARAAAPHIYPVAQAPSGSPARVVAGKALSARVVVRNRGHRTSSATTVGLYVAPSKGKQRGVRVARAKLATLRAGRHATVKLTGKVPAKTAAGTYRLLACVARGTVVPPRSGCVAAKATLRVTAPVPVAPPPVPAAVAVIPRASLSAAVAVDAATPDVGDTVAFTVTAANAGPDAATGVTVAVPLPAGLTFASADPGYNAATRTWTVGALAPGASARLTLRAVVTAAALPSAAVTATVHGDQADPSAADNTATAKITPPVTDLAVQTRVSDAAPGVDAPVTYTVTVTNTGSTAATGVAVAVPVPGGLTARTDTPSAGTTYDAGTGVWTVGALAPGASAQLTVSGQVSSPAQRTLTATLSGRHTYDTDPSDDHDSVVVTPDPTVDLTVTVTPGDIAPYIDDGEPFTIDVHNNGPSTAHGVSVAALLPASLTYIADSGDPGVYDPGTGVWTAGTIASGATAELVVVASVTTAALPSAGFTATVNALNETDRVPGDNAASTTVTPRTAGLSVAASVNTPAPAVGTPVTFTVRLSNAGANVGTGVQLTAALSNNLTFVSAVASQGTYDPGSGAWDVGEVAVGTDAATLTVTATPTNTTTGTLSATIDHALEYDANTANNQATATVTAH